MLNFHATFVAAQHEIIPVRAIQQNREIEFEINIGTGRHHHALHDVALDIQPENCLGDALRLRGGRGNLDATGFTATTGFHLGFDDGQSADLLCGCLRLIWSISNKSCQYGNAMTLKHVSGLVFV